MACLVLLGLLLVACAGGAAAGAFLMQILVG